MESVKELVEGYCQITGRPAFTITVDEYIKFHQLAALQTPLPWEKREALPALDGKKEVVEAPGKEISSFAREEAKKAPEEPKMERKEEKKPETPPAKAQPQKKEEPREQEKKPVSQMDTALALLKSISG